jgi:tetratricopeptide (TPR) repeat protein
MQYIETALAEEPLQPYYINNRGYIHLLRQEYDLARDDIDRSITLDPQNAWAYRNKGRWYHSQGNYQEAIQLYLQALQNDTFIQKINLFLGDSYLALGDTEKACEFYREGFERKEAGARDKLAQSGCDIEL